MRIGWSPYAAPAGQNAITQGGATSSFAQLLAAGYSADAIREQRALGFGETGLLGAPRKADRSPASQHSGALDGPRPDLPTIPGRQDTEIPVSRQVGSSAPSSTRASAVVSGYNLRYGRPLQASSIKAMALPANGVPMVGAHLATAADRSALLPAHPLPAHQRKRQRPKRSILLTGPEEEASLIIYLGSEDAVVDDRQISGFYFICSQYGVTLDAVRLFEEIRA